MNESAEFIYGIFAKPDSSEAFSEDFVDRAIKILGNCAHPNSLSKEACAKKAKKDLWLRLNEIKNIQFFEAWVPPAKVKNIIKKERGDIKAALEVLHSLKHDNKTNKNRSDKEKLSHEVRKYLFQASSLEGVLSGGLLDYDIISFDKNFAMAVQALEKIEVYFETALAKSETLVKGRGGSKPEKLTPDLILYLLAKTYKEFTGELPVISVCAITNKSKNKFAKFLKLVLPHTLYPYKTNDWALEKSIRKLKSHKIYSQLWLDAK